MWYFSFQPVSGYLFSEELDLEDVMDIELDFPTIPETLNSASSSRHTIPLLEVSFLSVVPAIIYLSGSVVFS